MSCTAHKMGVLSASSARVEIKGVTVFCQGNCVLMLLSQVSTLIFTAGAKTCSRLSVFSGTL